jgi:dihydroflavonol-4-reductase
LIVITGVSGLVGANLARVLVAAGKVVRGVIHQDLQGVADLGIELVQADLRDLDSLVRAFKGAEVVFHLAGLISLSLSDWQQLEAVNVQGTSNVVTACRMGNVRRLVHFSSVHALVQEPFDLPVNEQRALALEQDDSPYDRSKALGEQIVRQAIDQGLDAVILNPTAIIGPHDYRPSHVGKAMIALAVGRLPVLVDGGFDWVDVRDVVQAAIRVAEAAPAGRRYLIAGHWKSVLEVAEMAASLTGFSPPRFTVPLELAYAFLRITAPLFEWLTRGEEESTQHVMQALYTPVSLQALRSNQHISHARLSQELGYQPRPFEQTIQDTLCWFAEQGMLELPVNAPIWQAQSMV